MIAIDTNILVYASRTDLAPHSKAEQRIAELIETRLPWAIPWHCVHEFLGVVTNSRLWNEPTPMARAWTQIETWLEAPFVVLLTEGPGYRHILEAVLRESGISGSKVHDARVAALCREHGIETLWSADRDFSRFSGIRVVNPLK